jgi:tRNA (guanine-N(7)-)-methyltransferase subunit TRM82
VNDSQTFYTSSYIVTSDRDEKIRVTNYPATHDIEAFCVGHKEFVASVAFFNDDQLLLSASGDKTLRFWNYKTGKQVQLIETPFVPVSLCLTEGFLAIGSDDNTIFMYKYETISSEITKLHLLGEKKFPSAVEFIGRQGTFFIKLLSEVDGKKKLQLEKATITNDSVTFENLSSLEVDPSFKLFQSFDVSLLFKKKFDNVKQYIDRKKARIENQEAKRNKQ